MASNVEKVRRLLEGVIPKIPDERSCHCHKYLDEALL
jgi:hypothetical protein